jgi:hypothetical protein
MKSEVYSWRLSPELKMDLEREAREQKIALSALLERMAQDWLMRRRAADEKEQARIRTRVEKVIGKLSIGCGPYTNETVAKTIYENLAKKHGRRQPH